MELNKIFDGLENIEVDLEDEDNTIFLLCALPRSYENFKDTMFYDKVGIVTLEEIQASLRTKEFDKSKDLRPDNIGEGVRVLWGAGKANRGNWKGGDKSKFR